VKSNKLPAREVPNRGVVNMVTGFNGISPIRKVAPKPEISTSIDNRRSRAMESKRAKGGMTGSNDRYNRSNEFDNDELKQPPPPAALQTKKPSQDATPNYNKFNSTMSYGNMLPIEDFMNVLD
jgi:hypothetical protein